MSSAENDADQLLDIVQAGLPDRSGDHYPTCGNCKISTKTGGARAWARGMQLKEDGAGNFRAAASGVWARESAGADCCADA
ncbi:hypothetical protein KCP76_05905 [Salmonella enterica subsp. enterica serovar Weltevreden]|nr:hypothetical protein KCP76_05905 [Salmonella enterica subsp. enterica serovar Weltevreden]